MGFRRRAGRATRSVSPTDPHRFAMELFDAFSVEFVERYPRGIIPVAENRRGSDRAAWRDPERFAYVAAPRTVQVTTSAAGTSISSRYGVLISLCPLYFVVRDAMLLC
jgi:hypothetical protein